MHLNFPFDVHFCCRLSSNFVQDTGGSDRQVACCEVEPHYYLTKGRATVGRRTSAVHRLDRISFSRFWLMSIRTCGHAKRRGQLQHYLRSIRSLVASIRTPSCTSYVSNSQALVRLLDSYSVTPTVLPCMNYSRCRNNLHFERIKATDSLLLTECFTGLDGHALNRDRRYDAPSEACGLFIRQRIIQSQCPAICCGLESSW